MKRNIYMLYLIILFTQACKSKPNNKETAPNKTEINSVSLNEAELKNSEITTGFLTDTLVSIEKELNGIIDVPPQNNISISFPMGGYLKSTPLIPGTKVVKGQAIAIMEDPQFIQIQQDFLIAQSNLEMKEAEYLRQKELNASKSSSDKVYQQAKADFETTRISLKALGERLELLGINPQKLTYETMSKTVAIRSPVNGVVSKVNVNVGKYVNPSDVLFEIVDRNDIHLKLTAFENDAGQFSIGQEVTAYNNYDTNQVYLANIILISPTMLENTRSFEIHCHFKGSANDLVPGMYMNAKIKTQNINAYLLPENAVVSWHEKNYIFIDKGHNEFEMVPVLIAYRNEGMIGIEAGKYKSLEEEKVVLNNAHFLLMKLKNSEEG